MDDRVAKAIAYNSMLLTMKLAVAFNPDTPGRAIKDSARSMLTHVKDRDIRSILMNATRAPFALGWLAREEQNIKRISGLDVDQFLTIGRQL